MCKAPCCGTHEDLQKLMDSGYGDRLMLDDLPGGPTMLKPAMKGFESQKAPWETSSEDGCTFWVNGKCELHNSELKPIQGKLAHHSNDPQQDLEISKMIEESWSETNASQVIENFYKFFLNETNS